MRPGLLRTLLLAALACRAETCVPLEHGRIRAQDLAGAVPEFAALPPDTPLAYGPAPGTPRIFRAADLRRLAARFGLKLAEPADVCFELPMAPLDAGRLAAALHALPSLAEARIEIIDFLRQPVPNGLIEFLPQELGAPSDASAGILCQGAIRYGDNRKFAIWARAKITARLHRVVAIENLKAGKPIAAGQLREEEYEGFPTRTAQAQTLDQIVGRLPIRSVIAGGVIWTNQLREPDDVARGESVDIEVRSGLTRLAFTARAESAGRRGDTIAVRNPQSGKTFSAKVSAKGKAIVIAP